MVFKSAALFLCCLGLTQARVIATNYSPVVSPVYSSFNPTLVNTVSSPVITKTISPVYPSGPYYESIVTTHESKQKSLDGSQHSSFSKTLDTAFSKVNKFESRNDGVILTQPLQSIYSVPAIHSDNTVYHDAPFTHSYPIVYNAPVLSKRVTPILKKTEIVSPAIYSSPIVTKTVTPVLNKAVLAPAVIHDAPLKNAITYSPTPLVAHASFTGMGTSYSW